MKRLRLTTLVLVASCLMLDVEKHAAASDPAIGILWFNQAVNEATVLWEILPSGHVFLRVNLIRTDGLVHVRTTTQHAYRFTPDTYARARAAMVAAGLRDGSFMECGERARAGITPQLQLNLVSEKCSDVAGVIGTIERLVGSISENAMKAAREWADEIQHRAQRCPLPAKIEVKLTKTSHGTTGPQGIAECLFPKAYTDDQWSRFGNRLEAFEHSARVEPREKALLPVTLLVPARGAVPLLHGFDPVSFASAQPRAAWAPGTQTLEGAWLLPLGFAQSSEPNAKVAWIEWPPGYPVKSGYGIAPALALWLLPPLWGDRLSIELKVTDHAPALIALRNGHLICEGFRFCTELDEPRLRGLVSGAMGACIATRRELRREPTRNALELHVRAAQAECLVRFRDGCVGHQMAGLDALVDNLEPAKPMKPLEKLYPICGL